jgi:hypothetical protein
MNKKIFNPEEWLQKPEIAPTNALDIEPFNNSAKAAEIEQFITNLEERRIDLTDAYSKWRDIGFALASELGEEGRDYFHRISTFYPEYNYKDCDHQYSACLKSKGTGITLKTLFYHLKNAGINIANTIQKNCDSATTVPVLPDDLFPQLPDFLKRVVSVAEASEERDILLLGSIVCLSACLPNLFGIYHNKKVFANLFLFVSAKASAGKGRLVHCRQLLTPIHKQYREESKRLRNQYESDMVEYQAVKKKNETVEKPKSPPEKMLLIPANNSATGFFQLLNDNEGKGMIFETEGDTIASAFKSDYGNYSDGFRKAFHHETISYYRRTDREYVDIESPCLSALLSGTPKQVFNLIPDAENGLFSRFIFYSMNLKPVWADVFDANNSTNLDDYFQALGNDFYQLYQQLEKSRPIQVKLTAAQKQTFSEVFSNAQKKYLEQNNDEFAGTVRRMGIIAFRLMMILSTLRIMETGEISTEVLCEERDFRTALTIADTLLIHASVVFSQLPRSSPSSKPENRKERFYRSLPEGFNRQKYLEVANSLGIPDKTAQGYIANYLKDNLIHRDKQDEYVKIK